MPRAARARRGSLVVHADGDIVVRRDPDRTTGRMVLLDGMEASYVDIADPEHLEFAYLRWIRDAVDGLFPSRAPIDVVHIGGAGCALARHFAATRPRSRNEVYEYDARVADMARRVLGVHNTARLKLRVTDAREALAKRAAESADVVVGDAFVDGLPPHHLVTAEFAADVARVLRPGGLYALNVIDIPPQRISRRIAATLREVFGQVALLAPQRALRGRTSGNHVFLATAAGVEVDLGRVRARAARDGDVLSALDADAVAVLAAGSAPVHDGDPL